MAHLFTLHENSETYVKLQKCTHELDIIVEISTEFNPELKPDTTCDFLDHMVDTFAWGSCLSIGVKVTTGKWRSTHTIAEDVAITLGAAMKKIYYRRLETTGTNIIGWGMSCLDETLARATIGVEGRRNAFISVADDCPGGKLEIVEDMLCADMVSFVTGFFQGFPATCHLDLLKGTDPHHVWESAFHAMGEALRMAMAPNPWRLGKNNPYYAEEGIADASLI